ncbi:MAG: MFS transporter [Acidobacteriales bacterium]|nr:MFS transporter [Terriglobales bacterium]
MGGNYYIYDSINPLERIFIDKLGYSATGFGWLNASYSVAAVLTLLIGGIIIDRIGTKKALTFFAVLCLLGAALTAARGHIGLMIAGRTVLGLGAETMIVAVTVALAKWFKGKELSFAFGINLTVARLASVAADNSPTWANRAFYPQGPSGEPSWQNPLLIAVGAGVLAVFCALIYWILETRAEGRYELGKGGAVDKIEFGNMFRIQFRQRFRIRGLAFKQALVQIGVAFWQCTVQIWRAVVEFLRFNRSYWYVVALCFTFYSAIFPFRTFAIDLFTNKILTAHAGVAASEAIKQAGFCNSLLPFSAMIATPLFGLMVDRIGKRALFMMLGSVLLMPVYLMMAYLSAAKTVTFAIPWFSAWHFTLEHVTLPVLLLVTMSMMGIAFSLIPAIMWPSVAYVVDQSRLGTAYALMTMIQQIGFFMLNLLIGRANDYSHAGLDNAGGYALGMWIFSILGFVGLTFAILLRIWGGGCRRRLRPQSVQRKDFEAASDGVSGRKR